MLKYVTELAVTQKGHLPPFTFGVFCELLRAMWVLLFHADESKMLPLKLAILWYFTPDPKY